jgi:hypothetical protein
MLFDLLIQFLLPFQTLSILEVAFSCRLLKAEAGREMFILLVVCSCGLLKAEAGREMFILLMAFS